MIELSLFAYSDEQWNDIKGVVRDALGLDADQIERRITRTVGRASITGMQPLRDRIELTASLYNLQSASARQSPRRAELIALRRDTENLQASIIDALAVQVATKYDFAAHPLLRPGVDADMLTATSEYFRKLVRNLDRQIEQAGTRRDNARKLDRDQCWDQLTKIWCALGGKPHGAAAADFLMVTSLPVMASAVPTLKSVVQWLERRQFRRKAP